MLLHTMTETEIKKEIFNDSLEILTAIRGFTKSFVKSCKHRLPKMFPLLKFYTYKTTRGNDIMILLDSPDYKSRNNPIFGVYFFTKTPTGSVRVYQPSSFGNINSKIIVFTSHFISRYNNRMGLMYSNVYDILKHYITNTTCSLGEINDNGTFYGTIKSGMIFGTVTNEVYYHTTFVNNDMLFNNQLEYVTEVKKLGAYFDDIRDAVEAHYKTTIIPEEISQILQPK